MLRLFTIKFFFIFLIFIKDNNSTFKKDFNISQPILIKNKKKFKKFVTNKKMLSLAYLYI